MASNTCRFESDVVAAAIADRIDENPDRIAHIHECATCRDAAEVAELLRTEQMRAADEANVPSAGQVWWRAQVRAKAEAQRAAYRPILITHALASACLLGIVAALMTWAWPWLRQTASWLQAATGDATLGPTAWVAIGAWLVLAPVALYLVFARE
jgi:hypothetical protein